MTTTTAPAAATAGTQRGPAQRHKGFKLSRAVLYIFLTGAADFSPAVSGLIQGASCRDLGWGTACSVQPLD